MYVENKKEIVRNVWYISAYAVKVTLLSITFCLQILDIHSQKFISVKINLVKIYGKWELIFRQLILPLKYRQAKPFGKLN